MFMELDALPDVRLGERAFEIALARDMAAGRVQTQWFARHGSTPTTEIPARWPQAYRDLVQRRLDAIATNPDVALIERPEYKRRWQSEPWDVLQERALRSWLLDRLEAPALWPTSPPALRSCAQLADQLLHDAAFQEVAAAYRGRPDFDLTALVTELVLGEAVPLQRAERYKPSGLRKRREWEATWDLQRREDAIEARTALPEGHAGRLTPAEAEERRRGEVGTIPVPPKYASGDFKSQVFWRHRGKLDVPKERFGLLPGSEREGDPTPVVLWAGYDPLQQAQAIAAYLFERKERDGWARERVQPLLAALHELLPWLKQWHDAYDPGVGMGMGEYFEGVVSEEARSLGLTLDDLDRWEPAAKTRRKTTRAPRAPEPAKEPAAGSTSGDAAPKRRPRRKRAPAVDEV